MIRKLLFGVAALAGVGFASSAQAVVFTVDDFTGADASATIEVVQDGDNLQFTTTVTSPSDADIRTIWFNVADDSLIPNLEADGADVTGYGTEADIPNDAELTPRSFEFGVLIGAAGNDDIMSTIFTLSLATSEALDLDTFFAADPETGDVIGLRLKSIPGNPDSSKLAGDFPPPDGPPTQVPEPGMLLLLGTGLLALGLARRARSA